MEASNTVDESLEPLVPDEFKRVTAWYDEKLPAVSERTRLRIKYFAELSADDVLRHKGWRRTRHNQVAMESAGIRVSLEDFEMYCLAADWYYHRSFARRDLQACTAVWWTMLRLFVHACWRFDIVNSRYIETSLEIGANLSRSGLAPPMRVMPMLLLWCLHAFPVTPVCLSKWGWVCEDDEFNVPFMERAKAVYQSYRDPQDRIMRKFPVTEGLLWVVTASRRPIHNEDLFSGDCFAPKCVVTWLVERYTRLSEPDTLRLTETCRGVIRKSLATVRSAMDRYEEDLLPWRVQELSKRLRRLSDENARSSLDPSVNMLGMVNKITAIDMELWSRSARPK
ncbi:hypothetical protein [Cyprinid herpesvirus 3]|uniref:Uncharacterized protein n=1 Tax=Cyprinid herpesvirus 3 TaxID=180230 RepID=A3QMT6_CYHV3|nr:hypothetical protein [Cyprinid herpesvirus 3]